MPRLHPEKKVICDRCGASVQIKNIAQHRTTRKCQKSNPSASPQAGKKECPDCHRLYSIPYLPRHHCKAKVAIVAEVEGTPTPLEPADESQRTSMLVSEMNTACRTVLSPPSKSIKHKEDCDKEDCVYVISNPAFEHAYKIGRTKNISNRFSQYQTYAPQPYKLEYVCCTSLSIRLETEVLQRLRDKRLLKSEWIEMELYLLIEVIEAACQDLMLAKVREMCPKVWRSPENTNILIKTTPA